MSSVFDSFTPRLNFLSCGGNSLFSLSFSSIFVVMVNISSAYCPSSVMLSFLNDVGWGSVIMFFLSPWSSGDCSGFKAYASYRMKRTADMQSPCGTPVSVVISSP